MRIVVCAKEVLDPDAVNNYAIAGRLQIGEDGKTLTQTAIPRLMNGFDEQALEAALRLRDAGAQCTISVVSVGGDAEKILKHAGALGADELVSIQVDAAGLDHHAVAALIAARIQKSGGADLVLCGRQASDDDQGVVPALIGEKLGLPVVTIARAVERVGQNEAGSTLRVTRVTPDGDEIVEVSGGAVVSVSNELGDPRYPTAAAKIKARKMKLTVVTPAELGLADTAQLCRVKLVRQFVPTVHGHCEFIAGDNPAQLADRLIERLRKDSLIQ